MNRRGERIVACVAGLCCHAMFAAAVGSMAWALAHGLQGGFGRLHGTAAVVADLALALQFPLLHSWLLSRRGRRVLTACAPAGTGRTLQPTTYAISASLQLLATFWAWSPIAGEGEPALAELGAMRLLPFALAWVFLQKALLDAGLAMQSGFAGWWALLRGRPVAFGELPTRGLFARCRQPIYLGFFLVLVTAPCWTIDWLMLTAVWGTYCVIGPRLKEARWLGLFGERFAAYKQAVPYFVPRLRP
jgi:methanethiol S-methyltransferase